MKQLKTRTALSSKAIVAIVVTLGLPIGFSACGDVHLSPPAAPSFVDENSSVPAYTKPALAARGTSCLMCHAQVTGDIITDFGYQNPFILNDRYGMRSDAWTSAQITGNVILPHGLSDPKNLNSPTLKQVLQQQGSYTGPIVERNDVFIGAPTDEVITNLTHLPDATLIHSEWDVSAYAIGNSFLRGMIAQQGPQGDFFWTTPIGKSLWCEGDIILLGPIHLNNLILKTGAQGCRIYTKNSVFITGPVNYTIDSPAEANLQLSSSRGIFLGMRDLEIRLSDHLSGIRAAPNAAEEQLFNQKIYEDRDKIGPELIEDTGPFKTATCGGRRAGSFRWNQADLQWRYFDTQGLVGSADIPGCSIDGDWAGAHDDGKAARKTVNYHGLVLNAPKVHGRYFGKFRGLVIGEDVLFAISNFVFEFDPTFSNLTVLPLLKGRILRVSDQ